MNLEIVTDPPIKGEVFALHDGRKIVDVAKYIGQGIYSLANVKLRQELRLTWLAIPSDRIATIRFVNIKSKL